VDQAGFSLNEYIEMHSQQNVKYNGDNYNNNNYKNKNMLLLLLLIS